MILPTPNIAPDRALLTIAGQIFSRLHEPTTVSRAWDDMRAQHEDRPLSYGWFLLAVDLLFCMSLVWFDQNGLLRRGPDQV
jgi:hypothetical protein